MDDNSKYRDLFFEETDEYLQTLNDCLLQLEKDSQDSSLIDEIFRAAHTLKGMAATMGYESMAELTHHMENVLELFRSGASTIDSEIISLLLSCLDKLSEIVEDLREEKYTDFDIEDLVKVLDQVAKQNNTQDNEEEEESTFRMDEDISDTDLFVIKNAQDKEYNAFHIGVRISKDSLLKGARAFLIINRLEQGGEILQLSPSAEDLEEGNFEDRFTLIYLTRLEGSEIEETIGNIAEIEQVIIESVEKSEVAATLTVAEEVPKEEIQESNITPMPANKIEKNKDKNNAHHVNQSIRVDLSKLDSFMNLVSELVIYRTRLEDLCTDFKTTEINEHLEHVARITSELQDLVLKIRMQPVNVVFNRFPRMIRDLSKELNKEIELVIEGEDTELDRTVVSEIGEPLIHLLRNAADHGIESVEERVALGKPEVGTVKLSAYQEGNRVVITVSDDGKGIDPEAVQQSAMRKGISTEGMSPRDMVNLIFSQGFSTAKEVTNVSGRGVGMDVVKQKIIKLGGSIEVQTEVNKGSTFVIKLPLTLSIIQALLVNVGEETFALPLGVIEKVVKVEKDEILQSHNSEVYIYRNKAIPIIRVNKSLGIESERTNKHIILVLLGDQYYGLLVDDLIGQQEIVIKKLSRVLGKMREYLGATILGDGDITLILDVSNLSKDVKGEYLE
ncbi:two-component system chemotaxis sensor kinase CheA [Alkalibaculum bacchi]|uniref:Chemotaxis protein CheA n=1 Tax=Alkalibaculum bacchi TaxID=645887 RepID=A0A366IFK1_9FIRM|nr:chemotaxis protein CheA [Alkalibaculum bacchi]RBP70133.1 two-component system chemotaxis sensor kinase CheA [Alkalibaculum bacchi]